MAITAEIAGTTINVATSGTVLFSEDNSADTRYIHNRSDVEIGIRLAASGVASGAVAFYLAPGEKMVFNWRGPVSAYHGGTGTKAVTVGQE